MKDFENTKQFDQSSDESVKEKMSEKKGYWTNSNPFDLTSDLIFVEDET
jgi:hypothetical protein|tara:strand:- start:107 stop:253 length:147 start_codon:yes stop_codon:yes gene_type:complete